MSRKQIELLDPQIFHHSFPKMAEHPSVQDSGLLTLQRGEVDQAGAADVFDFAMGHDPERSGRPWN